MAGLAGTDSTDHQCRRMDALSFQRSADVVVMLILGGTGGFTARSLAPPLRCTRPTGRDQPQYWYFGIGVLLMLVVLFMPKGILGFLAVLSKGGK